MIFRKSCFFLQLLCSPRAPGTLWWKWSLRMRLPVLQTLRITPQMVTIWFASAQPPLNSTKSAIFAYSFVKESRIPRGPLVQDQIPRLKLEPAAQPQAACSKWQASCSCRVCETSVRGTCFWIACCLAIFALGHLASCADVYKPASIYKKNNNIYIYLFFY